MQHTMRSPRCLSIDTLAVALLSLLCLSTAQATFILEIDTDGTDDGVLTFNPNFSFGGDTTLASQSNPSTAVGMTGGDSIFGGNGVTLPDTYVFSYDPSVDADNFAVAAGTDLGGGLLATGLTGGAPGVYAVYGSWPNSINVSGGNTQFSASTAGDSFAFSLDQNNTGNQWYKLGEITWSSGLITVTQQPTANTFVSMRAAGLLFEYVPEPSTLGLLGVGFLALAMMKARQC